jgi:hypothetical protein
MLMGRGKTGNVEEGHHDIEEDEEVGANDDEDHYDDDKDEEADTDEVPLTSGVRDPHLQDSLLKK